MRKELEGLPRLRRTAQHSIHNANRQNSRDGQPISIGILQIPMGGAVQCAISLEGVVSRPLLQTPCHRCLIACEARAGGLEARVFNWGLLCSCLEGLCTCHIEGSVLCMCCSCKA
jgi:hypothetical protein